MTLLVLPVLWKRDLMHMAKSLQHTGATAAGKVITRAVAKPIGIAISLEKVENSYNSYGLGAAAATAAKETASTYATGVGIAEGAAQGFNVGTKIGAALGALAGPEAIGPGAVVGGVVVGTIGGLAAAVGIDLAIDEWANSLPEAAKELAEMLSTSGVYKVAPSLTENGAAGDVNDPRLGVTEQRNMMYGPTYTNYPVNGYSNPASENAAAGSVSPSQRDQMYGVSPPQIPSLNGAIGGLQPIDGEDRDHWLALE